MIYLIIYIKIKNFFKINLIKIKNFFMNILLLFIIKNNKITKNYNIWKYN